MKISYILILQLIGLIFLSVLGLIYNETYDKEIVYKQYDST